MKKLVLSFIVCVVMFMATSTVTAGDKPVVGQDGVVTVRYYTHVPENVTVTNIHGFTLSGNVPAPGQIIGVQTCTTNAGKCVVTWSPAAIFGEDAHTMTIGGYKPWLVVSAGKVYAIDGKIMADIEFDEFAIVNVPKKSLDAQ